MAFGPAVLPPEAATVGSVEVVLPAVLVVPSSAALPVEAAAAAAAAVVGDAFGAVAGSDVSAPRVLTPW
jgi:hypothetical protein